MTAENLIVVKVAVAAEVLLLTGEQRGPQLLDCVVVEQEAAPEVVGASPSVHRCPPTATAEINRFLSAVRPPVSSSCADPTDSCS